MKVIGLTGSIGSGKSTVSNYLRKKGYIVIDSDMISREVVRPGSRALKELVAVFGMNVLTDKGELDRKTLAKIAFSNHEMKAELESIVTSRIVKSIKSELNKLKREGKERVVFVDAPILFESKADVLVDSIWLVVAEDKIREKRVMERDGCSAAEFKRRSESQLAQEEKIKLSDFVIDNSTTTRKLYAQIRKLLKEFNEGL